MTPAEKELVDTMGAEKWQPATRELRDSIDTQDLLAQGSFWSREYQLNPGDLEAAIKLAAAVRKMGNPIRAIEITQTTRALYPKDPYLIAEYAAALISAEQGATALPVIEEGLRLASGYARLWSLRGAALDQSERYADARKSYERALSITPYDPNILANLGLSFALEGDAKTAEMWLTRAMSIPGASESVQRNLDLVRQLNGKAPSAPAAPRQASRPAMPQTQSQARPQTRLQTFQPGQASSASDALRRSQSPSQMAGARTMTSPAPLQATDPNALARLARNASPHTRGAPQPTLQQAPQAQSPFAPKAGQVIPPQAAPQGAPHALPQGYPQAYPAQANPYAQPGQQYAPQQQQPQAQPQARGPLRLRR
jgi:Flp pilus assembly protein TadD